MKFSLSIFSALFVIFLASCNNPCQDVDCGEHGTCDEGTCLCDIGYEGVACDTKTIDKFLGSYTSNDFQCDGFSLGTVNFVIEEGSTLIDMVMYDEEEPEIKLILQYTALDLFIPAQEVDGTTVSGQGTLNADGSISFIFEMLEDEDRTMCAGHFTK